jgi:hypothetical protein
MSRPTAVALLVCLLAGSVAGRAAAQLPPDARWRTFETAHFHVHFHDASLEPAARRAAAYAEQAWRALEADFIEAPRAPAHLVVADNVDVANGYASTFPRNVAVVYATPPSGEPELAPFDDWLRLVTTHEVVHLFHLDHAGGARRVLRRVFGRAPDLFPHHESPNWLIEGLAVHYETRLTDGGRLRGSHARMVIRAAALEDDLFPIDRASGDPARWPGGQTRYVYGAMFTAHLVDRFGERAVSRMIRDVGARLVPWRLDAAARRTLGVSLTDAWGEWADSLRADHTDPAELHATQFTEPDLLTPAGRSARFPRIAADGSIAYATEPLREDAATRVISPHGTDRLLAKRTSVGPVAWHPDGTLLSAELDWFGAHRLLADLYRVSDRRRERVTRGARLRAPDVHPAGHIAVAVGHATATDAMVVVDLASAGVRPLVEPEPDVHWSTPRWSPDGRRIVAARWAGGRQEIVILSETGAALQVLPAPDGVFEAAPTWAPDGGSVVFSSDRGGRSDLYRWDPAADSVWQVTRVRTGAFDPSVAPDGSAIVFSLYGAHGYRIARIPWDPASWPAVSGAEIVDPAGGPGAGTTPTASTGADAASRSYRAIETLPPTGWSPILEHAGALGTGFGASVDGRDVVARHLWQADALVFPTGGRVDLGAWYRFRGIGALTLDLAVDQGWSVLAEDVPIGPDPANETADLLRRSRRVDASVRHDRPGWRSTMWIGSGADVRRLHDEWTSPRSAEEAPLRAWPADVGARLFAGRSSARGYALSISPEDGSIIQLSVETRRFLRPREGETGRRSYLRGVGVAHGYLPIEAGAFARHVVAVRGAAGAEAGAAGPGFGVGGVSGTTAPILGGLGLDGVPRAFGVRGYPAGVQRGDRALAAHAEYRVPLVLVERGYRLWPIFVDRIWTGAFADAAAAWCTATCEPRFGALAARSPDPIASAGAEVAVRLGFGRGRRSIFRAGLAIPLLPDAAGERPGPSAYLVGGRAF